MDLFKTIYVIFILMYNASNALNIYTNRNETLRITGFIFIILLIILNMNLHIYLGNLNNNLKRYILSKLGYKIKKYYIFL